MKSTTRFTKKGSSWDDEQDRDGRPRRTRPQVFKLRGIRSGDAMIPGPLHPTRDGQREVIVASLQKTIIGPGIAHVCRADNPLGRTYAISASHLPEEALLQFQKR